MQAQHFNERGQSMVEIALLLPILIILFLGIAEVGFFLFSHVQVANAARSGTRDGLTATSPLGRTGKPEDAAGAVYLFCIPESNFVTGEVLTCSGGL